MHWGPQSIPGVDSTWYARRMHEQDSKHRCYEYHCQTYGHPSKFGYKDLCALFTAEKFDQDLADTMAALYKRIGAGYVVPVASFHDNFDMWDSTYQPRWNSMATAGKDVLAMWKQAANKHGLRFGVAAHFARAYRWLQTAHGADRFGPMTDVPYDGQDPEFHDLYGVPWTSTGKDWDYEQMSDIAPPEFEGNFEKRMLEVFDRYQPDLYYTDGGIPFRQKGLNLLAHMYNNNPNWNGGAQNAVATIKLDWVPTIAVMNYEFDHPETIQEHPWQTDKTMGSDWFWERDSSGKYKSAQWAIRTLMNAVSCNGNLLLNVPPDADGVLDPEVISMLEEMGRCLDVIGEAVFATRCWVIPNDGTAEDGTGDIRFTRNKANTSLYITHLGPPGSVMKIKALAASRIDLSSLGSLTALGSSEKISYNQEADSLHIRVPTSLTQDRCACAFKLDFNGPLPELG